MEFSALLLLLAERLHTLLPLLAVGLVLGELVSIPFYAPLAARTHALIATMQRKLNRPNRTAATRVYRGMIALGVLLVPAIFFGHLLSLHTTLGQLVFGVWMIAMAGHAFRSVSLLRIVMAARRNRVVVTPPFTDHHGVLRQALLSSAESFSVQIVGSSLWYVLAGPIGVFAYLVLASAAMHFGEGGFGWSAHQLFRIANALPRLVSCLLLGLAACFVPHTSPLAASRQWHFRWFVATLMGASLGGPVVTAAGPSSLPWAGRGTAQIEARQISAWVMLRLVASLIMLIVMAAPIAYPMILYMYFNVL